jgi:heme oxygenase
MAPTRIAADRLRAATAASHDALDHTLGIVDRLADPCLRPAALQGYYRLHAAAEAAIIPWLEPLEPLDLASRLRAPSIAAAIARSGAATDPAPPDFAIANQAAALGVLYVLEGSSLGGRLIRRDLAARGTDLASLDFMDPYGAQTGAMWRALLELLEQHLAREPQALAEACAGATAAFALAGRCLSDVQDMK